MAIFQSPEEVAQYLVDQIELFQFELGLEYIGFGEENFLPRYPACVVALEPLSRVLHATQQFLVTYRCSIYIYHARLDESHRTRTLKDIELATGIRRLLHNNFGCRVDPALPESGTNPRRLVFSWIEAENPGVLTTSKGDSVVGTRLVWVGENVEPFKEV